MSERLNSHLKCGDSFELCHIDSNSKSFCLASPVSGSFVPMQEIPDDDFSKGNFGDCAGFLTEDPIVCAPCTGRIVAVASAKHGLGILNKEHGEIAIQVGIGTEKMGGSGFLPVVCIGDEVEAGDPILKIDHEQLRGEGYEPLVVVFKLDD